jgi:hypothetical protein
MEHGISQRHGPVRSSRTEFYLGVALVASWALLTATCVDGRGSLYPADFQDTDAGTLGEDGAERSGKDGGEGTGGESSGEPRAAGDGDGVHEDSLNYRHRGEALEVYAVGSNKLYKFDPERLTLAEVGAFEIEVDGLAMSRTGQMVATERWGNLYLVDRQTADVELLAGSTASSGPVGTYEWYLDFDHEPRGRTCVSYGDTIWRVKAAGMGLAFVPGPVSDGVRSERLVSLHGCVFEVDVENNTVTVVGDYGRQSQSDNPILRGDYGEAYPSNWGDIAFLAGFGFFGLATGREQPIAYRTLVRLDPDDGFRPTAVSADESDTPLVQGLAGSMGQLWAFGDGGVYRLNVVNGDFTLVLPTEGVTWIDAASGPAEPE